MWYVTNTVHMTNNLKEKGLPEFAWQDLHELSALADNNLPAILKKFGILEYSEALSTLIEGKKRLSGDQATELRLVAIEAVNRLALAAPNLKRYQIGLWLLSEAKKIQSELNCHLLQNTLAY